MDALLLGKDGFRRLRRTTPPLLTDQIDTIPAMAPLVLQSSSSGIRKQTLWIVLSWEDAGISTAYYNDKIKIVCKGVCPSREVDREWSPETIAFDIESVREPHHDRIRRERRKLFQAVSSTFDTGAESCTHPVANEDLGA